MTATWVPDRFQLKARNFLRSHLNSGLFLSPGFGKTSITLSAITHLIRRKKIGRVLIVAPVNLTYAVWPEEIKNWLQFEELTYTIVHGKHKLEALHDRSVDIHITNYDSLAWIASQPLPKRPWDLIVLDESSNIKHTTTIRSKALRFIQGKGIPYCWILNGSPVSRSYEDLFGQLLAMDKGKTLGSRLGSFRKSYFRKSGWGQRKWTVTAIGKRKIKEKVESQIFSLSEAEYGDLPELKVVDLKVKLPPDLMAQYHNFIAESFLELETATITAANAGVLTGKALQFTSGKIYHDDDEGFRTVIPIHDLKEKRLLSLLDELQGNQALIGYRFIHERETLQEILKPYQNPVPALLKASQAAKIQREWNQGKYRVLIGNPKSMSHGLNLQKFKEGHGVVIFYTLPHEFDKYDQMIRRIRRRGFYRMVIVYRILVEDTIDCEVVKILKRKEADQTNFMNHLATFWNNYRSTYGCRI